MNLTIRFSLAGLALTFALLNDPVTAAEVVVVVSAQSPINTLQGRDLEDIFLGRQNQLPNGKPIIPVDQAESRPVRREFYSEYLGRTPAQVKAHWSKLIFTGRGRPPHSVQDGVALADFVAGNPSAIGYIESDYVDDRLRVVVIE